MHFIALALAVLLTACAPNTQWQPPRMVEAEEDGNILPPKWEVNELAHSLVNDLVRHYDGSEPGQRLAVTTPVFLEQVETSSPFARQLGEAMTSEMHRRGVRLVELNATERIKVTSEGNLLLSRDFEDLARTVLVDHIVVTTLAYSRDDVQVNSRIVSMVDRQILATSQGNVPWQHLADYVSPAPGVTIENGLLYRHDGAGQVSLREWGQ